MKNLILCLIALATIIGTMNTNAGIRRIDKGSCIEFQLDNEIERGQRDSEIISSKVSYGIIATKIKIDFDKRNASFILKNAISLGFNRVLADGERVFITDDHSGFDEFVDMYQKDLHTLKSICISDLNEIIAYKVNSKE